MPPKPPTGRILKPGAAPFCFFEPDGTARTFPIYFDPVSKKESVDCNKCGTSINQSHLSRHQASAKCIPRKAELEARWVFEGSERQRAEEAVRVITEKGASFRPQSLADLAIIPAASPPCSFAPWDSLDNAMEQPVTPTAGVTPLELCFPFQGHAVFKRRNVSNNRSMHKCPYPLFTMPPRSQRTAHDILSHPLPFDLLSKVHISLAEGRAMGVSSESITKYREDFGIPDSDAFDVTSSREWEMKELQIEDQRNSRKRSESEVSKSSSAGRDASPTKIQRLHLK